MLKDVSTSIPAGSGGTGIGVQPANRCPCCEWIGATGYPASCKRNAEQVNVEWPGSKEGWRRDDGNRYCGNSR